MLNVRTLDTAPLPVVGHMRVEVAAELAATEAARAELRAATERLYPYGPPPERIDPNRWVELTQALEDSRYVLGLPMLTPAQIRNLAGFLADRILIDEQIGAQR